MRFLEKLNEYVISLEQDEQNPVDQAEIPTATPAPEKEKIEVAPEGYTEMVRFLQKLL